MSKRVAVIGGGISGLTTAFLLKKRGFQVKVFEASDRLGGNVQTVSRDGYTFEEGPNSFRVSVGKIQEKHAIEPFRPS